MRARPSRADSTVSQQGSETIADSGVEELGGETADEFDWTDIDVEERDE